ncbi:hypothetical protein [Paenibacillus mendelii]|uniref:Uncharacterized protein n=1 Tax=Paenibacillus mendelii TaxID=206163 RepID=A0ABV6JB09_9BACL|nr:hypothetical protein [Paenibacillus mendelii]MCQ6564131.1 hypothetical protein [Paenibacillus mendelii]
MRKPYEERNNHPADFRVKYRFYSQEEGGRKKPVLQGYRSDFTYDEADIRDDLYCIHPEFEDEQGNVILNDGTPVPIEGTARMWILFPEMRKKIHLNRIKVGVIGYFMEGPKKVAKAEVIEVLGLHKNAESFN